jgi:hypothetical protein
MLKDNSNNELDKIVFYISLNLLALSHITNYILGQINQIIVLLLLIAIYIFIKSKKLTHDLIAGLFIGLSVNLKPITILIIPFLLTFSLSSKNHTDYKYEIKRTTSRIIGAVLPISLNLIFFILFPEILNGFIIVNFVSSGMLDINNSSSITRLLLNTLVKLNINQIFLKNIQVILFFCIFISFGGFAFIIFIFRKKKKNSIFYGITLGVVVLLIVFYDTWDHHFIILIPLLILLLISWDVRKKSITEKNLEYNIFEKSLYFFVFLDLICFVITAIANDFFPFNFLPTIFLILIYFSIARNLLKKIQ